MVNKSDGFYKETNRKIFLNEKSLIFQEILLHNMNKFLLFYFCVKMLW